MLIDSDTQLNQNSYYEASVTRPTLLQPLQEAIATDVLVVGAGFAGLSAGMVLALRGYSVAGREAHRVC